MRTTKRRFELWWQPELLSGFFVVVLLFAVASPWLYRGTELLAFGQNCRPNGFLGRRRVPDAGGPSPAGFTASGGSSQPADAGVPSGPGATSPADTPPQPSTQPERAAPVAPPAAAASKRRLPHRQPKPLPDRMAGSGDGQPDVRRRHASDHEGQRLPGVLAARPQQLIRVLIGRTPISSRWPRQNGTGKRRRHPVLMK